MIENNTDVVINNYLGVILILFGGMVLICLIHFIGFYIIDHTGHRRYYAEFHDVKKMAEELGLTPTIENVCFEWATDEYIDVTKHLFRKPTYKYMVYKYEPTEDDKIDQRYNLDDYYNL